jgi:aryl-alcohol dehydrogenase-like predicted oxidoreductase
MEYVELGNSAMQVSRIGFGCDPLGGHAWGAVDADEAVRAVRAALDRGVTLFDTADCYGLGESERLLGTALGARRNQAVIASKFGVRIAENGGTVYDNSPAWLDAALDASLARLGVERIDLYQIHYWDRRTPLMEIFDRLERKRADGKIGWYGITNIDLADHLLTEIPPGLVSFSFEYSLADRAHEETISRLSGLSAPASPDLAFLSWGSLGQGILTGKYDRDNLPGEEDRRNRPTYPNFHGEKLVRNLRIVEGLRACRARAENRSPAQCALRWILDRFDNSVVLTGIKSRAQLDEIVGATEWRLEVPDFHALDRLSRRAEFAEV